MAALRIFGIAILCSASLLHAADEVVFEDNFDQASDNAPLPFGPNHLDHGIWTSNHTGDGAALLTTEAALSPPRSLALRVSEEGRAQVVGTFSEDGVTPQTLGGDYTVKFAFMMKETVFPWTFYIQSTEGQLAVVQVNKGAMFSSHQGGNQKLSAGLMADTWYILEVDVSGSSPGSYDAKLYSSDKELLGSTSGAFSDPEVSDAAFFTIYHATEGTTLYVDTIKADKTDAK